MLRIGNSTTVGTTSNFWGSQIPICSLNCSQRLCSSSFSSFRIFIIHHSSFKGGIGVDVDSMCRSVHVSLYLLNVPTLKITWNMETPGSNYVHGNIFHCQRIRPKRRFNFGEIKDEILKLDIRLQVTIVFNFNMK